MDDIGRQDRKPDAVPEVRRKVDRDGELTARIPFNPRAARDIETLVNAWLPFILSPAVIGKLGFIHGLARASPSPGTPRTRAGVLRARRARFGLALVRQRGPDLDRCLRPILMYHGATRPVPIGPNGQGRVPPKVETQRKACSNAF